MQLVHDGPGHDDPRYRLDVGTAFCGEVVEALETYMQRSGAQPLAA